MCCHLRGAMVCMHQTHDFMPYLSPNLYYLEQVLLPRLRTAGLNCLLVEYEVMYPFSGEHRRLCCSDAFSRSELEHFINHAASLGIQVIPLLQTLGHMYHVLIHPEYSHLAEVPGELQQLCPSNPETLSFLCELLDDIMNTHPESKYIHLGGDECRLLGKCPRCKGRSGSAFMDYYRRLTDFVIARGRIPILWHDKATEHPEFLEEFDPRVVFHFWNYGDHCHGRLENAYTQIARYLSPERIIGGPSARNEASHGSLLPSYALIRDNIRRMDSLMLEQKTLGGILTDWPDSGMPFPLALPAIEWHGQLLAGGGIHFPDSAIWLDAIYGATPFAMGFQTRLESYLNRYVFKFASRQELLQAFPGNDSAAVLYSFCHRRILCREALDSGIPDEYAALQVRTLKAFLSLAIGRISENMAASGQIKAGYQLDVSLAEADIIEYKREVEYLRDCYRKLYSPLSFSGQIDRYLEMLFRKEFLA